MSLYRKTRQKYRVRKHFLQCTGLDGRYEHKYGADILSAQNRNSKVRLKEAWITDGQEKKQTDRQK